MPTAERTDVIVVGARCAGSAAAIALARAGRRVVVLDAARFPSDTLSTHLIWPAGVAELHTLGALPRVLALGAPRLTTAFADGAGHSITARFPAVDGVDYALCVRRTGLDAALVATAREAGADIREGCRATELVRDGNRVAGVRYHDGNGHREIRAQLVVGADGRRSAVARKVGVDNPYREAPSGRACYFAYWRDTASHSRDVAAQWREDTLLGTAFPCDDGLVLALVQPPVEFGSAGAAANYAAAIAGLPGLEKRLLGCEMAGKVRVGKDLSSYFRRSSGPGWALAGDAGHFKDPVTAQGIRDAMRYGRLLGEAVAPLADDPEQVDAAARAWERTRDRECLEVYQWTNQLARGTAMSPIEVELYRAAATDDALATAMLEVFSRTRRPAQVASIATVARLATRAVRRGPAGPALSAVGGQATGAVTDWFERTRSRILPLPDAPRRPRDEP